MSSWRECKLGDILEEVIDNRGRNPEEYTDFGIPVIDNFMIKNQKYINLAESKRFLDDETFKSFIRKHIQNKDVLITLVGNGYGNISQAPKSKAVIIQNTIGLRCNGEADNDFLFYCLKFNNEEILNFDRGAVQPSIKVGDLKSLEILLPPLEEQKAIAEVLSSLDDKIDLLHRQNQTLESLAQTLFRQWFIEEAKEEWEVGTLDDIVYFNPSYRLKQGELATYLAMESVQTDKSSTNGWYKREVASGAKFMNNDTLLARITPSLENGKTAFVDFLEENEIGWGSTEFIIMKMKENYHPFLSYLIARNQDFRDFAVGCMTGSTGRQRAQAEDLKKYEITIPPFEEVQRLNKLLEPIPPKIKANWKQIQTLENLRDTLLPKLLSGEVRVEI
ncbi:MAG: restriction endonuclease subunit S [Arcobacteraceae bacterium]|jgi:type I restriction enzyme S subunit|nr:restriction endonuclease subunit S [Arcobacteraceae bacterium]